MDKTLLNRITPDQAWHYKIVPYSESEGITHFYSSAETISLKSEIELLLGFDLSLREIAPDELTKLLEQHYRKTQVPVHRDQSAETTNSKDFLSRLIREAKSFSSSDIHLEVYEKKCRVRIRIDGKLVERYSIDSVEYPVLINKVKIMANLDIAEKRLPQDGRIFFNEGGSKFDIRVSILPTLHGEKIVLRLLNNDATDINIETLGFDSRQLSDYLECIKKPNGIILISGPTGSGKTTTLYATLKLLNQETHNILTIEDPIEYTLEGINQVQLKENIGLDFSSALKTFLRQDPDIIMVGEIRDPATANMAVRASLTGHLVLSTIHTNSAWDTISRLIDMDIPPYLIATTLNMSIAQRLVRKLCPHCKKEQATSEEIFPKQFKIPENFTSHFIANGCSKCFHTGYKGRIAIYEVIPIDFALAEEIKNSNLAVSPLLKDKKIQSLAENALKLAQQGITSVEEIYPFLLN